MLDQTALNTLFHKARSHNGWQDKPVTDEQLKTIYELTKWGPTSANCSPARIVFVRTSDQKEKLAECVLPGNVEKVLTAPVVAVIGMDMAFPETLPKLFPHTDARSWFVGNQPLIEATAFRNSSLQGGYFILAARALGLDCGPMSGFDPTKVDALFFPDSTVKSNFICGLGYGDSSKLFERSPRPDFNEVCKIV